MKFTAKECIIISLTILTVSLWFVEWQDFSESIKKAYSRVFYLLCVAVTLLYLFYIGRDCRKWHPFVMMCYSLLVSFSVVNLFLAFHTAFVGIHNWELSAYEIDRIIEQSHENYIIDYGTPIIIFVIAILINLWWKYRRF